MKDKALTYELIEKYLDNTASADEISEYELRFKNDAVFQQDVKDYLALKKGFEVYKNRENLRQKLNAFHLEMEMPKIYSFKKWTSQWRPMFAAASVAIVFSFASYLFFGQNNKQPSHYKALKKEIESVKKTQSKLWAALNEEDNSEQTLSSGTGLALAKEGYILTNYHLIQGAKKVFITNEIIGQFQTEIIYIDAITDIAILKIKDSIPLIFNKIPYSFSNQKLKLGEKIFTLGYPNDDIVFGEGYISCKNGYDGDTMSYQISIPLNPGNSGGPLLDEKGNIAGIITGKHTENEGTGFALKSHELNHKISSISDSLKLQIPHQNKLNVKSKLHLIEKLQPYIFSVETIR